MILLRRQVLYWQAGLLTVVSLLAALGTGVLIGRGVGPIPNTQVAAPKEVLVRGWVKYTDEQGNPKGDPGAVVLMAPEGQSAELLGQSFNPDNPPTPGSRVILALEEIGGRYDQTNAEGRFLIKLPRPGRYVRIIISHDTMRPAEEKEIDDQSLAVLESFLTAPIGAIGNRRFDIEHVDVAGDAVTSSHDFGQK